MGGIKESLVESTVEAICGGFLFMPTTRFEIRRQKLATMFIKQLFYGLIVLDGFLLGNFDSAGQKRSSRCPHI